MVWAEMVVNFCERRFSHAPAAERLPETLPYGLTHIVRMQKGIFSAPPCPVARTVHNPTPSVRTYYCYMDGPYNYPTMSMGNCNYDARNRESLNAIVFVMLCDEIFMYIFRGNKARVLWESRVARRLNRTLKLCSNLQVF